LIRHLTSSFRVQVFSFYLLTPAFTSKLRFISWKSNLFWSQARFTFTCALFFANGDHPESIFAYLRMFLFSSSIIFIASRAGPSSAEIPMFSTLFFIFNDPITPSFSKTHNLTIFISFYILSTTRFTSYSIWNSARLIYFFLYLAPYKFSPFTI